MQRFFSLIVIFAILAVGGGYLWVQKADEDARQDLQDKLADARRTFADKARSVVAAEDEEAYLRGIQQAVRAYDEELKKRVYNKKPDWRDPTAYKKEVEARFKEGGLQEAQYKSMLEGYELVKDAHDTLMAANWRPVITKAGAGETRIDIYDVSRTRDDEGNPVLEGKFFFWGIEDSTRLSWGQLALRYWTEGTETVKEHGRKVEKAVEKVLGRAEGDSQPRIIIQNPHKYVASFPSYVAIGRIWLPVMPREAQYVDIEYGYAAKKGGGQSDALLKWPKYQIPDRWKLKEGEVWDADVVEATEDEIAGREGTEEPGTN